MMTFLHFCSGADTDILRNCSNSEKYKYAGIGAVVLFTAIMAAISASYALFTIFENQITAVGFGLIWGLMIFNLDRFILTTLKRRGVLAEGRTAEYIHEQANRSIVMGQVQSPEKRTRYQSIPIMQATPRLLLAVVIAIVISKPLEMKIFEKEIDQIILEEQNALSLSNRDQIGSLYNPQIEAMSAEVVRLRDEITAKEIENNELYATYIAEAEGRAGTGLLGKGPVYKEKREKHDASLAALQALKVSNGEKIASLETQIASLQGEYETAVASTQPVIDNVDGLMARLSALNKLPQLPSMFIMLLFLIIETAPIIAKLLAPAGEYEDRLANAEDEKLAVLQFDRMKNKIYADIKLADWHLLNQQDLPRQEKISRTLDFFENYNRITEKDQEKVHPLHNTRNDRGDDGDIPEYRQPPAPVDPSPDVVVPLITEDDFVPLKSGGATQEEWDAALDNTRNEQLEKEYQELGKEFGDTIRLNNAIIQKAKEEEESRKDREVTDREQEMRFADINDKPATSKVIDPLTLEVKWTDHNDSSEEIGPSINQFYREMRNHRIRRNNGNIFGEDTAED
ncbi:DUF4407 domain-containing protein [Aureicoccus marinus]|nr:DUF4407 domain-containing protein [Aureicoccus marinus]